MAFTHKDIDAVAAVLRKAWDAAEPGHPVTIYPVSYAATFADMARAVLSHQEKAAAVAAEDLWYLQDRVNTEGEDVAWRNTHGTESTTDLRKARVYSWDELNSSRDVLPTDCPWPKAYIDKKLRAAINIFHIDHVDAITSAMLNYDRTEEVLARIARKSLGDCHAT